MVHPDRTQKIMLDDTSADTSRFRPIMSDVGATITEPALTCLLMLGNYIIYRCRLTGNAVR